MEGLEYFLEPLSMVLDDADNSRQCRRFPGVEIIDQPIRGRAQGSSPV
jgi:hypothetical protein